LLFTHSLYFRQVFHRNEFRKKGGYCWIWLGIGCIIGQIVTIPLAIIIHFKIAYIFTYIVGYVYGSRFKNDDNIKEKRIIDILIYVAAIVGVPVRIILNLYNFDGVMESVSDLLVQWFKLFQGAAIFIAIYNIIPAEKWKNVNDNFKKAIQIISKYTYEIYLVHEFFTKDMFTQFINLNKVLQVLVVWIMIAATTFILVRLEKAVDFVIIKFVK
jgi:membrane-bound acyltransferase YfiQ involved in biofilm formation